MRQNRIIAILAPVLTAVLVVYVSVLFPVPYRFVLIAFVIGCFFALSDFASNGLTGFQDRVDSDIDDTLTRAYNVYRVCEDFPEIKEEISVRAYGVYCSAMENCRCIPRSSLIPWIIVKYKLVGLKRSIEVIESELSGKLEEHGMMELAIPVMFKDLSEAFKRLCVTTISASKGTIVVNKLQSSIENYDLAKQVYDRAKNNSYDVDVPYVYELLAEATADIRSIEQRCVSKSDDRKNNVVIDLFERGHNLGKHTINLKSSP